MNLRLVLNVLDWHLDVELGRQATELVAEDLPAGDALTGLVVDSTGTDQHMGFTNGLEDRQVATAELVTQVRAVGVRG